KDSGVGITEKEKAKLFEKFGKIERYGMDLDVDIEGSGFGLYISKEIVELHGGQISVESEGRNKGTTFKIRLFKK
ncbi:MAG: sensor histidine kinase, partial [Promethearchaeota archaeon]